MPKAIDKEECELIVNKYSSGRYSVASLSREVNRNDKTVAKVLNAAGIKVDRTKCGRDFTINHNYFDIIDTEEKAYFLGLMYADGCNMSDRSIVKIALQDRDKAILDKLSIATNSNRPLEIERKSEKHKNWKDAYTYRIHSKKMCESLNRLGCVPRKSLILKFPTEEQVPSYLIRHFIRGYFDGDGCVTSYMGGRHGTSIVLSVSIVSTCHFLYELYDVLNRELGIHCCIHHDKRVPNKTTRILCIGCDVARKFLNWIYDEASVCIERKFTRYKDIEHKILSRKLLNDSKQCQR